MYVDANNGNHIIETNEISDILKKKLKSRNLDTKMADFFRLDVWLAYLMCALVLNAFLYFTATPPVYTVVIGLFLLLIPATYFFLRFRVRKTYYKKDMDRLLYLLRLELDLKVPNAEVVMAPLLHGGWEPVAQYLDFGLRLHPRNRLSMTYWMTYSADDNTVSAVEAYSNFFQYY